MNINSFVNITLFVLSVMITANANSQTLPSYLLLKEHLESATSNSVNNGGMFNPGLAWAAVVDRDGIVQAVATVSGKDAWPAGRLLAVIKASTANAFSNNKMALSTANLYSMAQPGGSMYGIQNSIPINPRVYTLGQESHYGTQSDPLVINKVNSGGISVIAGGLPLYNQTSGEVIGAIGVSGDSPCAAHVIAWRIRHALGFTKVPAGPNKDSYGGTEPPSKGDDNIIFNENHTFGYPFCNIAEITVTDLPSMENF